MRPLTSFLLMIIIITSLTLQGSSIKAEKQKKLLPNKNTHAMHDLTLKDTEGCAGIESVKKGGKYDCEGYFLVKARNICYTKKAIKICIEVFRKDGTKYYDCSLTNIKPGETTSNWSCNSTGRYYTQAEEPK